MIVRHSFASKISSTVDVKGKPHIIIRQVYWAKAVQLNKEWREDPKRLKYFYYEVKPIDSTTGQTTLQDPSSRPPSI